MKNAVSSRPEMNSEFDTYSFGQSQNGQERGRKVALLVLLQLPLVQWLGYAYLSCKTTVQIPGLEQTHHGQFFSH